MFKSSLLSIGLIFALTTAVGADNAVRFELNSSFSDRAKWKSFGAKGPMFYGSIQEMRASRTRVLEAEFRTIAGGTKTARIKSLIALAEAGAKGYDTVHMGAGRRPPKNPTDMTLAEIQRWIRATPNQPHAIGR